MTFNKCPKLTHVTLCWKFCVFLNVYGFQVIFYVSHLIQKFPTMVMGEESIWSIFSNPLRIVETRNQSQKSNSSLQQDKWEIISFSASLSLFHVGLFFIYVLSKVCVLMWALWVLKYILRHLFAFVVHLHFLDVSWLYTCFMRLF